MERLKIMKDKVDCFIIKMEGDTYIIPQKLRDKFDGTDYYQKRSDFSEYILGDDAIIENIFIDDYDLQCLIEGEFG